MTLGRHLLVNMYHCGKRKLDDLQGTIQILEEATKVAGATKVGMFSHQFDPRGVSVVIGIAESHISIHTWPETGDATVDVYTCGEEMNPDTAAQYIIEKFDCKKAAILDVNRNDRNGFQTQIRRYLKPRVRRTQGAKVQKIA